MNPIARRILQTAAQADRQQAAEEAHQAARQATDERKRFVEKLKNLTTSSRKIKVALVIEAAPLLQLGVPPDSAPSRTAIDIVVDGRTLRADVATKAVRKAVKALQEHGSNGVALMIQGSLGAGDTIEEAGLVAQMKNAPA